MSEPKPQAALEPTDIAGRYQIVKKLGAGAFGTVYKARDRVLGRMVAIKTIRMDGLAAAGTPLSELLERFEREAQVSAQLRHPNIVTVHDIGKDGDLTYLAMEFIDGVGLERIIATEKRLSVARATALAAQVADALDFAHKNGVVHRDIKPANIMVEDGDRVKVTDFGIAKVIDSGEHLTMTGSLLGTPSYMSPEQARGVTIDGRSDLFAVGCILYELVAGQKAFRGDSITGLIFKIITEEPTPVQQLVPDLPEELVRIVNKALAKSPEARYQSGRELKDDLLRLTSAGALPTLRIGETPTSPGAVAAVDTGARTLASPPTAVAALATQVSATPAAGATVVTPPHPPPHSAPPPAQLTPRPAKKGVGVGVILALLAFVGVMVVAAGVGVWYFFLRQPASGGTEVAGGGTGSGASPSPAGGGGSATGTSEGSTSGTTAPADGSSSSGARGGETGTPSGTDSGGATGARTADAGTSGGTRDSGLSGRRPPRGETAAPPDAGPDVGGDQGAPPAEEMSGREAGARAAEAYRSQQRGPTWGDRGGSAQYGSGRRFNERPRVPAGLTPAERIGSGVLIQIQRAEQRYNREHGRYATLAELKESGTLPVRMGPGMREFVQDNYQFSLTVESDGFEAVATPRGQGLRALKVTDAGFVTLADE